MPLAEGQFQLGAAVIGGMPFDRFALGDLAVGDFDVRTGIVDNTLDDGSLLGRDRYGKATWSFTIHVIGRGTTPEERGADLEDALEALAAAWRPPECREPGKTVTMTYRVGGRLKAVRGRPGKFTAPKPDFQRAGGYAPVVADFTVTDPVVYDLTNAGSVELRLLEPNSDGGVVWDADGGAGWPFWWDGQAGASRAGLITNTGSAPVPFTVTIHGPMSAPWIAGPGWRIDMPGLSLPYDRAVTIDTEATSCTWDTGASASPYLSRTSSLSARLAPGAQEITVGGADGTGTGTFTFSWLPGSLVL